MQSVDLAKVVSGALAATQYNGVHSGLL